jgi:glycosyltransferase involved in cell wall biosynthesis
MPSISVIIPTFNRGNLIGETIESILRQTCSDWEMIVVDDGSEDNTADVVGRFTKADSRIKFIVRPSTRPKGANSCRNVGLEVTTAQYVKWLDSDDVLDPECLQQQVDRISTGDFDVCFCQTRYFKSINGTHTVVPDRVWGRMTASGDIFEAHVQVGVRWASCAGLWRRSFLGD